MYFQHPGPLGIFCMDHPFFSGIWIYIHLHTYPWHDRLNDFNDRSGDTIFSAWSVLSSCVDASTLFHRKPSEHFFWSKNTPTFSYCQTNSPFWTPFCNIMHVLDVCVSFRTHGIHICQKQPTSRHDESWHTSISWRVSTDGWSTPKTLDRLMLGTKMAKNTPMKFCIVD